LGISIVIMVKCTIFEHQITLIYLLTTNHVIMNDISEILRALLDQLARPSEVEREFTHMMNNDQQLKEDYELWCEEMGYDVRTGYQDFIDEQMQDRDEFWEELAE